MADKIIYVGLFLYLFMAIISIFILLEVIGLVEIDMQFAYQSLKWILEVGLVVILFVISCFLLWMTWKEIEEQNEKKRREENEGKPGD